MTVVNERPHIIRHLMSDEADFELIYMQSNKIHKVILMSKFIQHLR